MSSSQFGQPFFRKSTGSWMMEQRRQALNCFERACDGIAAADMLDCVKKTSVEWCTGSVLVVESLTAVKFQR